MHTRMWLERGIRGLVVLAMALTMLPALAGPALAAPTELFFSEYVEGSSNNKALEIYNGTGAAVDLAAGGYSIVLYSNGSPTASLTVNLTGTVADGDVFVFAQSTAAVTILAQADQTSSAGLFNGDDAIALRKGTTVLDVIGQIGFDPGTEWGSGLTSTADNTLRRKDTVCAGDPDGSNVFDPALEWDGFATDTFDGLGTHVANCGVRTPVINEFSASHTGTDDHEYVEVYGSATTDYTAYTILEIEGDTGTAVGTIDEVIAVGTTDADGLWLGNLNLDSLENGTITLLIVKDFSGALNDDLDTDNDGVFDVMPWSEIVDAVAVKDSGATDMTYGVPVLGVSYDGLPFAPGGASRIPDGYDTEGATDWVRNDYDLAGIPDYTGSIVLGEAYNTPGAPNAAYAPPPEACGDDFTPIYAIQGSGLASPLAGTTVSLEGIVVGDFQNNASLDDDGNLNGFYVQDPTGDGDPATSDGIFVYASGADDVQTGDAVRVRGAVSEYNGMTEVTASQVWGCSTGNTVPAPAPLSLPVASLDDFEPFEGMLVTFPQALVISEYFNFDRYNEIVLTSERLSQPTAIYEPGSPEAIALADLNLRSRIMLDDGRTTQNSDPAIHPNGEVFSLDNLFRGGDTVANVTGVVDYSFGIYRIQPTQGADYSSVNPRTTAPDDTGGSLKVASFNVLNYFTTIDTGGALCGPGLENCRGADTLEEFDRQRTKIIAALVAMNADVVGLIEIENHPEDVPTADLVDGLNAATAPNTYAYVATGAIGDDAIRQAFIYKPATVSPIGTPAVLDAPAFTNPLAYAAGDENPPQLSRPALAQTFMDNTTGGALTVVVNHLKSKGSSCDAYGDLDLGDGQGNCNLTRTLGTQALMDWLASDPTGSGDPDVLLIGDLNAYDKEDPVDALVAGGYSDVVARYLGENAYSYVFDGQVGYLDHALVGVNDSLADEVTGVTIWHINADEPDLIDYDMNFKAPAQASLWEPTPYRSSDHDPVIIGLNLSPYEYRYWFPLIYR